MALRITYSPLWWMAEVLSAARTRICSGRRLASVCTATPGCERVDIPGLRGGAKLLQAGIHQVERESDGDGGDDDADHQSDLLETRRGADEIAGFEVLRGITGVGRGDGDDAADGDGQCTVSRSRPALDEEDGACGHEGGDGHAGHGIGRAADEADDARAYGDKKKSEDDDEQRGGDVRQNADLRARNRLEGEEDEGQTRLTEGSRRQPCAWISRPQCEWVWRCPPCRHAGF